MALHKSQIFLTLGQFIDLNDQIVSMSLISSSDLWLVKNCSKTLKIIGMSTTYRGKVQKLNFLHSELLNKQFLSIYCLTDNCAESQSIVEDTAQQGWGVKSDDMLSIMWKCVCTNMEMYEEVLTLLQYLHGHKWPPREDNT